MNIDILNKEPNDVEFKNSNFHQHICFKKIKSGEINSFFVLMETKADQQIQTAFFDKTLKKSDFLFPNVPKAFLISPSKTLQMENLIPMLKDLKGDSSLYSGSNFQDIIPQVHSESLMSKPSTFSNNHSKPSSLLQKCKDRFL